MRRILYCLVGAGLTASLIMAGTGCSDNPMSSEDTIAIEQEQNQDVVSEYVSPQDPGGHPTTPATGIDKYESDNSTAQKSTTP